MIDRFVDGLLRNLRELRTAHESQIVQGRCASLEDYKNSAGVIRGLSLAEDTTKALLEKLRKGDDDDDDA